MANSFRDMVRKLLSDFNTGELKTSNKNVFGEISETFKTSIGVDVESLHDANKKIAMSGSKGPNSYTVNYLMYNFVHVKQSKYESRTKRRSTENLSTS